jgi:hypothetical protein
VPIPCAKCILTLAALLVLFGVTPAWAQQTEPVTEENAPTAAVSADEEAEQCEGCWAFPSDRGWGVTLYGGWMTLETLASTIALPTDLDSRYGFLGVGVARRLTTIWKIDVEIEGQMLKHIGADNHWELNGLVVGRWSRFPWNKHVLTSVALGGGISYASSLSEFEGIRHEETKQTLGYLLLELTASHPRYPQWALSYRIHHRSGLFGAFGEVHGASNGIGIGARYRF